MANISEIFSARTVEDIRFCWISVAGLPPVTKSRGYWRVVRFGKLTVLFARSAKIYDGCINIILKVYVISLQQFILFDPFPLQLAPLFVIIGTGCVGAVAFTIRQATKNPEAWYVGGRQFWEKSVNLTFIWNLRNTLRSHCHKAIPGSHELLTLTRSRTFRPRFFLT